MNNIYATLYFLLLISGCDQKHEEKTSRYQAEDSLVQQSLNNMVDIKGGSFMMGDFGPLIGEKSPLTGNDDDKELHKVTLSDFSMGKYKVTFKEYDEYSILNKKNTISPLTSWLKYFPNVRDKNMPAIVNWQQAREYCLWLGEQSNKKIDLPTESQWEYAARNRGGYVIFATNNGKYEPGSNLANSVQKSEMLVDSGFSYPIGKFPPTPLGLFDMAGNGVDWISDWYDDSYYNNSPEINPQGPDNGVYKVIRGYQTGGGEFTNQTVYRQFSKPDPDNKDSGIFPKYNFRCVVNK